MAQDNLPPLKPRVENVNTTRLLDAIRLGCHTMSEVFSPADRVPYFGSLVWPRAELGFSANHSESHVPGRHLNALVSASQVAGVAVDDDVIERQAAAAFFSYGGKVALPLNRETIDSHEPSRFLPHNLREGLHALYALVRHRNDARARELAERCIADVNTLWSPEIGWDTKRLTAIGVNTVEWAGPFITGIARALGPLVKYARLTGSAPAMALAERIAQKLTAEYFIPDGGYDTARFGFHTHSTTCVLSSLALMAETKDDAGLFARVKAFFDNGLSQLSNGIGWSIESTHPRAAADRGECNNTGDILETSLALARRGGGDAPRYLSLAERILRGHLLPSQLRDVSFVPRSPQDGEHALTVAERHLGAFGFPAPYGHAPRGVREISFNMDIVGGAVDSLCAALAQAVETRGTETRVHFLFDCDTPDVTVTSPYPGGTLMVRAKRPATVFVRVPEGTDLNATRISGPRPAAAPDAAGDYLLIGDLAEGQEASVRFAFRTEERPLRFRDRQIRTRWSGESVGAMENFGAPLAFFEPFDEPVVQPAVR